MARNNSNNGMTVSEFVDMCNRFTGLSSSWVIEIETPNDYRLVEWSDSYHTVVDLLNSYGDNPVTDMYTDTFGKLRCCSNTCTE